MSVPRITLWTPSFHMPFRMSTPLPLTGLVEKQIPGQPLGKKQKYDQQRDDIQKDTSQEIEMTPGSLLILSHIAGRRMTEPARWILFDSLYDILNGNLRTTYPERQDLLDATLGELLGVIFLVLQFKGDIEIIRFLESNYGKTPDFLLIQTTAGGQSSAHILECKGRIEDVHNINEYVPGKRKGEFDLCKFFQARRKEAKSQINTIKLLSWTTASRSVLRQKMSFGLSQQAFTKNIVVSSIPDSRAILGVRPNVRFTSNQLCAPKGFTCVTCMKNTQRISVQGNVISAHYQEKVQRNSRMGRALSSFLAKYQNIQRALWSGNDRFFERAFSEVQEVLLNERIQNWSSSALFLLIPTLEAAIAEGMTHVDLSFQAVRSLSPLAPEWLQTIFEDVRSLLQSAARRPVQRRIETLVKRNTQSNSPNIQSGEIQVDQLSEEQRQWYDTDPGIRALANFIGRYRPAKGLFTYNFRGISLEGSIRYDDDQSTIVAHLTSSHAEDNIDAHYSVLKSYVEGLIAHLRPNSMRRRTSELPRKDQAKAFFLPWRPEYFQEYKDGVARNRFQIGESWDEFPYPHVTLKYPGITAWISYDGRAEVIVRKQL